MVKKPAKSATPAAKKPRKVFDVSNPGKGAVPAAGSKHVIVSHHPMLQDPAVTVSDAELPPKEVAAKAPTATKVVIKPLSEIEKTEEPKTDRIELDIPDFTVKEKPKQTDETASQEKVAEKPAQAVNTETAEAAGTPKTVPEEVEKTEKTSPEPQPVAPHMPSAASELPNAGSENEKTKEEQEAAALEAEVKRQEEFDKLVESKQYFLPITTAEHRRSKVVTVAGLILIVLLGLLLVNLLMDVGTIRINGVEPLTQFFGS